MPRDTPSRLLPAPGELAGGSVQLPTTTPSSPKQRSPTRQRKRSPLNKFACLMCQKKKTKCDGTRPMCGACTRRRDQKCEYPVREGAVSRYSDLKETYQQLQRENHELKDLFSYLRNKPEPEAYEIYRRLRASDDPFKVLQHFRDAETLLALPAATSPGISEKYVSQVDAQALAESPLKVPARPWTSVAGDGIVSNLISAFFRWDEAFIYSFVDRQLFLRDMRLGDPGARYCSPLLVNAICATRALFSHKVKLIEKATGTDLSAAFLAEAKHHLDAELPKAAITTVQGLYMMFVCSCCDGTNRAGNMYHLAASDLLRRMNPYRIFSKLNLAVPEEAQRRRALSRLYWGTFIFECVLAESTQTPSLPPPSIPLIFEEADLVDFNLDVLGQVFRTSSPEPPLVPGVTRAACEISRLQHRIMVYNQNPAGTVGCEDDLHMRRDFFAELAALEHSLSHRLSYVLNPAPGTIYLKFAMDIAALNILRPLPPNTRMPRDPSNPAKPCITAKTLMIQLCVVDVEVLDIYYHRWGLTEYSPMIFTGMWNVSCTLISMLDGHKPRLVHPDDDIALLGCVPDLFTRACAYMGRLARDMASIRLVMQGLLALAVKSHRVIPPAARPYFDGFDSNRKQLRDVPVTTVLPVLEELGSSLEGDAGGDGEDTTAKGGELASLLESWSSLSLN